MVEHPNIVLFSLNSSSWATGASKPPVLLFSFFPTAPALGQPKQPADLHPRLGDRPRTPPVLSPRHRPSTARASRAHATSRCHRSQATHTPSRNAHRRRARTNGARSRRSRAAPRRTPCPGHFTRQRRSSAHAGRTPPLLRLHVRGLWQDVLQELPPQGSRQDPHRGTPFRVSVGRVRAPLFALRRALATPPDSHGREAVLLPAVQPALHAQRPPGQARQEARQQQAGGAVATGALRLSRHSFHGPVPLFVARLRVRGELSHTGS